MDFKLLKLRNSLIPITTTGGITQLLANSKEFLCFEGTLPQTVKMADATTTSNGKGIGHTIINDTTANITLQDFGGNLITTVLAGTAIEVYLTSHATANGVWRVASFTGTGGGGLGSGGISATVYRPMSRALIGGGNDNTISLSTIESIVMATRADGKNFGQLQPLPRDNLTALGSATRAIWSGGVGGGTVVTNVDYAEFATEARAELFGVLSVAKSSVASLASAVIGLIAGGQNVGGTPLGTIEFVTITTLGNPANFATMTARSYCSGMGGLTRGIISGGIVAGNTRTAIQEYVTYAAAATALNFGNMTSIRSEFGNAANSVRGINVAGYNGSVKIDLVDFVEIATLAAATSFGTLMNGRYGNQGTCSSPISCVTMGGYNDTVALTQMEYMDFASRMQAKDWGDLAAKRYYAGAASNVHGGI